MSEITNKVVALHYTLTKETEQVDLIESTEGKQPSMSSPWRYSEMSWRGRQSQPRQTD